MGCWFSTFLTHALPFFIKFFLVDLLKTKKLFLLFTFIQNCVKLFSCGAPEVLHGIQDHTFTPSENRSAGLQEISIIFLHIASFSLILCMLSSLSLGQRRDPSSGVLPSHLRSLIG